MKESELIKKAQDGYKKEQEELTENTQFLDQLKEANNERRKPLFLLWLSRPIPAYSLALATLFFLFLLVTVKPRPTELIVYNNPETLIQYDTIVMRDTIHILNETKNTKAIESKKWTNKIPRQKKINKSAPRQTVVNNSEFYFDVSQVNDQQNLSGTSANDSELAQFLGVNI